MILEITLSVLAFGAIAGAPIWRMDYCLSKFMDEGNMETIEKSKEQFEVLRVAREYAESKRKIAKAK